MRHFLLVLLIGSMMFCGTALGASVLLAGTVPNTNVRHTPSGYVASSIEQLFTLYGPADLTTLQINAASVSAQTLEVQLFSGLGLEGTGVLLQTFNISVAGGFNEILSGIPTITQAISVPLAAGSYSLLLTGPASSSNFIYLNAALDSNTPDGILGGTHFSNGVQNPGNIVFELDGSLGSTAPEPQSAKLLAAALFLGIGWLIRRRSADAKEIVPRLKNQGYRFETVSSPRPFIT